LTGSPPIPCPSAVTSVPGVSYGSGAGQSYVDDTAAGVVFGPAIADGNGMVAYLRGDLITYIGSSASSDVIAIYCRSTDGALVLRVSGTQACQVYLELCASGPYPNYTA
jgi:hypothetical protein